MSSRNLKIYLDYILPKYIQHNHFEAGLKPIMEFFTVNNPLSITFQQIKNTLDNFTNKSINIHILAEDKDINILSNGLIRPNSANRK
jgi:hypothetical protein